MASTTTVFIMYFLLSQSGFPFICRCYFMQMHVCMKLSVCVCVLCACSLEALNGCSSGAIILFFGNSIFIDLKFPKYTR